jgi:hypothetical protein
MGEESLLPIGHFQGHRSQRKELEKGHGVLPNLLQARATPKPVKNTFIGVKVVHWASANDSVKDLATPNVNDDSFVP